MIDDKLNPWLLEINMNSSLGCDSPLDQKIKSGLVTDLFNLIGVNNVDLQNDGKYRKIQTLRNHPELDQYIPNIIDNKKSKRVTLGTRSFQPVKRASKSSNKVQKGPYELDSNIRQLETVLKKEPSFNNLVNRSDMKATQGMNFKVNTIHNKAMNTFSSMDWSPYTTTMASRSHESIMKESEAEFKRKGNFVLLFPSALSPVNLYKNLFVSHNNHN